MKRNLCIALTFAALINMLGCLPLYVSVLWDIKSEVGIRIAPENCLEAVFISKTAYNDPLQFKMMEEGEFEYHRMVYDFRSMRKTAGGYIFYTIRDDKELWLDDLIVDSFAQSDEAGHDKMPLSDLLKNFSKDFITSRSGAFFIPCATMLKIPSRTAGNILAGYPLLVNRPPDWLT